MSEADSKAAWEMMRKTFSQWPHEYRAKYITWLEVTLTALKAAHENGERGAKLNG